MRSLPIRFHRALHLFFICSGLLLAQTAAADLIGAFTYRGGSSGGPALPGGVTTTGLGLSLYFGDYQDGICMGCFGYAEPVSVSQGSFEFTRANSPTFDAFVGRLTDTQDQMIYNNFRRYLSDGTFMGGGGGNWEQRSFTTLLTPDLVASIDAIRITFDVGYEEYAVGYRADYVATWEFFGTPGPLFSGPYVIPPKTYPETVPEPASLGMMLLALGFAAAARRRSA